ncbi:hypothetical protein SLS61_004504 [Didymella pomorum]
MKLQQILASNRKLLTGIDLIIEDAGLDHYLWAILRWPNVISFCSAADNKDFDGGDDFDVLQPAHIVLYEPFKTLLALDDTDGQAKRLRSVIVYMFMSFGLVDCFTTSGAVTREALNEELVAIKVKHAAGECEKDGLPLKDAVRFAKKVLERQVAWRSFGTIESKHGHLESYLDLECQLCALEERVRD